MKKYTNEFITKVVSDYLANPEITQKELAGKVNVPFQTVVGWLRCKKRGLTSFQRYKRNRDNLIRKQWAVASEQIKKVRDRRNSLNKKYGLTPSTVRQLVYRKGNDS